jgi:predicted secreted protein
MTSSVVNGTLISLKVEGVEIAKSQSSQLSISINGIQAITKLGGKWTENYPGYIKWDIKGSGLVVYDETISHFDLFSYMINRTKVTIYFSTDINGDKYFQGSGYITSLEKSAPMEANTSYKYTIIGTGELYSGDVIPTE